MCQSALATGLPGIKSGLGGLKNALLAGGATLPTLYTPAAWRRGDDLYGFTDFQLKIIWSRLFCMCQFGSSTGLPGIQSGLGGLKNALLAGGATLPTLSAPHPSPPTFYRENIY